jgi:hypothetical protein
VTTIQRNAVSCALACLFTAVAAGARAQTLDFLNNGVPTGPIVTGAPYSAEGVTTVKVKLFDGTRIERTVTARFYRDSAGRIRREQTIVGLAAVDPANESPMVVTIVDPVAGFTYALDPNLRTAHRVAIDKRALAGEPPPPPPPPPAPVPGRIMGPGAPPPPPPAPTAQSLGTRQIEGLTATGRRTSRSIPSGQIGNDRPIEIVDERWESPELKVLLFSRHRDPRTGDVEYRLGKISRAEPPAELFSVPAEYVVVDPPPPPPPAPAPRR